MLYYKKISSPLGEITLRSDGERLTGLWFADDKHYGDKDIQDAQNAELRKVISPKGEEIFL